MKLERIKAIIFDLDDTLIPSSRLYSLALSSVLGEDGSWASDYGEARSFVKGSLPAGHTSARNRLLYFKRYLEIRGESFNSALQLFNAYESELSRLISDWSRSSGRLALLRPLSQRYPLFILTNESTRTQLAKIGALLGAESGLIQGVLTSEEAGAEKPSAAIFNAFFSRFKIDPTDCLMVGDSEENDMVPAESFGMQTLLSEEFLESRSSRYPKISHLSEIKEMIR